MPKQPEAHTSKPSIDEIQYYDELLEDGKKQRRETDFKLLQMIQALAGVIGGALMFTTWFADSAAFLNISKAIQTIGLLVLGGILGYYVFVMSKHK